MVFSSPIFLFAFLPLALAGYFVAPRRLRNAALLAASLLFYAWGEPRYPWVLPASIAGNFAAGLALARTDSPRGRRWLLAAAVVGNVGLLVAFKYACFLAQTANPLMTWAGLRPFRLIPPHLPLGVSFFTFQAIAYVADVARRDVPAERRPVRFALAAALFPHLIAGPIVRYRDLAGQLGDRRVSLADFAAGVRRIAVGLAKKVLLANTLGWAADQAFNRPPSELGIGAAWLGLVCFALQIYFDFSGYSDMAIGLGRLFGFVFPENFRHPYAAGSVAAFWRRWHMTLSSWLRDYVYIPLGGGRRRAAVNVLVVFAVCGLWHGAAWTFVVWGLWHGAFLVAERLLSFRRAAQPSESSLGCAARRSGVPLRHAWTLLAVLGGWVLFRADSLAHAAGYFAALAGAGRGVRATDLLAGDVAVALVVGVPACLPVADRLRGWWATLPRPAVRDWVGAAAEVAVCGGLLAVAAVGVVGGAYNPFLYFRF